MSARETLLDPSESLFVVYDFPKKFRCGGNLDGGYVMADVDVKYDCLLSAGIAQNDDFSVDFIQRYNLPKTHCFGFDGSIDALPANLQDKMTFVKKNIGSTNDDTTTTLDSYVREFRNIFLKMDIEGGEWAWLREVDEARLANLSQIVLELHGITSTSWHSGLTITSFDCGYAEKRDCLKKLSQTHYVVHAHGNNADRSAANGLPNVLEVVYVNKNLFKEPPTLNRTPLPIKGLDFPNEARYPDLDLNFFPFVLKSNPFLIDAPDQEDYTLEDYAKVQAQLREKTIDADLSALYSPRISFYAESDFRKRISQGITQTLLSPREATQVPTKTLYTLGSGGPCCIVCCVPFDHTFRGSENSTRLVASQQILRSLEATGFQGHFYLFTGGFPTPTGTEMKYAGVPYAFKVFMMLEAEKKGFTKVLWIDSACYALNNPEPLFAALDKEAVIAKTVQSGNHWQAMVLPQTLRLLNYLTGTNLEEATYLETIVFGLNLANPLVKSVIKDYYEMVRLGWPFFSIFPEEVVLSALFHKPAYRHLLPTDPVNRLVQIHEKRKTEDQARSEGFYFHHKDYSKYTTDYHITFEDGGGRFGNQLFRYLICKVFTVRFGHKYVDRSDFHHEDPLVIGEEDVGKYLDGTKSVKNRHLVCRGYFQKSELFVKDREALLRLICSKTNNDTFVMDGRRYSIRECLVESKHSVQIKSEDVVMSVRLDDFLQLPCPTSDILPPTYYIDALTTLNPSGTLYIVVDALKYSWEHKYLDYFKKWKPVVIQNTLVHDIALMRDASTLIHSNSSLCWIISFLSPKVKRVIPFTPKVYMNQNQSLRTIADTDSLHFVTPLDHAEVYELDVEQPSVFPLSFCVPDECVVPAIPDKTSLLASLIPGDPSTYTFGPHQESEYNDMYRAARFAITKMKGGWDCLRHYEILMNGCIPLFEGLEDCPAATLTTYPKELNKEAYALYESWSEDPIHMDAYDRLCAKYLQHTRQYCTTSATAQYFLSKIRNGDKVRRILLLTGHHGVNYNRETLWIGLKRQMESLGGTAVEYDKMPFLYDDFDNTVPNKYYGANCYTFPKRLHKDDDYVMGEREVMAKIQDNYWDLILYGKVGPDEFCTFPFFDLVKQKYNRNKIAFIFGGDEIFDLTAREDNAYHMNLFNRPILYKPYRDYLNHYRQFGTCFVRELNR